MNGFRLHCGQAIRSHPPASLGSGNWGTFEGEHAFAFAGAVRVNEHVQVDAGVGVGVGQTSVGGRAGVAVSW
jgi:hypothetical protein